MTINLHAVVNNVKVVIVYVYTCGLIVINEIELWVMMTMMMMITSTNPDIIMPSFSLMKNGQYQKIICLFQEQKPVGRIFVVYELLQYELMPHMSIHI
jgi:hypothetical protein